MVVTVNITSPSLGRGRFRIEVTNHSGVYCRNSARRHIMETSNQSYREGRYNRLNGIGVWYGSGCTIASWGEVLRWSPEVSPEHLLARHFGYVRAVDLTVADLTLDANLKALGVTWESLRSDDYSLTQQIADSIWNQPSIDGIVAPGAPLRGHAIIVIRVESLGKTSEIVECEELPPPSGLREVLSDISANRPTMSRSYRKSGAE